MRSSARVLQHARGLWASSLQAASQHEAASCSNRVAGQCSPLLLSLSSDDQRWQQLSGSVRLASSWAFWRGSNPKQEQEKQQLPREHQLDSGVVPTGSSLTSDADDTPPAIGDSTNELLDSSLESFGSILQACDAVERATFQAVKADSWMNVSAAISGLQAVHDALGTPWWLSIAIFNIALRALFFPLMVVGQKATAKLMMYNHDLLHAKQLQEAAMKATSQEEHQRLINAFRVEYEAQSKKHGNMAVNALKMPGVMLANATIFISVFTAISKLMAAKVPSLTSGGALWFSDLTIPDPYWGLPLMCTVVTLAMVEFGLNLQGDPQMPADRQAMAANLKWMMRLFAFAFLPAGGYVAAGTAVLWVSNTGFGVLQGLLLRNDAFRARVGMPTMPELKAMNARVMEANAAASTTSTQPPPNPFSRAPSSNLATPLLKNPPRAAAAVGAPRPGTPAK